MRFTAFWFENGSHCVLKHFNNGNDVPMRSGSFSTMGTALTGVSPRNYPRTKMYAHACMRVCASSLCPVYFSLPATTLDIPSHRRRESVDQWSRVPGTVVEQIESVTIVMMPPAFNCYGRQRYNSRMPARYCTCLQYWSDTIRIVVGASIG